MKIFKYLFIVLFFLFFISSAFAEKIIVDKSEISKLEGFKYKILRKSNFGYFIIDISEQELKKIKDLKYRKPKKLIKRSYIPSDSKISLQWALENIKLYQLWDTHTDCSNIKIAIVDTGVNYNHEDLKDNIFKNPNEICNNGIDDDNNGFIDDCIGWNFAYNNNNPMDDDYETHGTHVAGIIAARGDNDIGVAGVCWEASIIPVKALDSGGNGTYTDVADAIDYAIKRGANIINLSVESPYDYTFEQAIKEAYENHVLIISAAGNQGKNLNLNDSKVYPASFREKYSNVINVGSYNSSNGFSSFSDYGSLTLDIAAPGDNIYSTIGTNGKDSYGYISGSSMATGFITGLVAHIMSFESIFNADAIRAKIIHSAKGEIFSNKTVSGGILDATKIFDNVTEPILFKTDTLSFGKNEKITIYGYNLSDVIFYDSTGKKLKIDIAFDNHILIYTPPYNSQIYAVNNYGNSNKLTLSVINTAYLYLNKGWNLISIPVKKNYNTTEKFSSAISIWKFEDNNWKIFSNNQDIKNLITEYGIESFNTLNYAIGYWVYQNSTSTETFSGDNYGTIWTLQKGWNLVGSGNILNVSDIFNSFSLNITLWKWNSDNNSWKISSNNKDVLNLISNYGIKTFDYLYPGEGFWIDVN